MTVYRYFEIDGDAVWNAIEHSLPTLKARVVAILAELGPPDADLDEAEA